MQEQDNNEDSYSLIYFSLYKINFNLDNQDCVLYKLSGPIAQLVEQGTHNPLVPGSSPGGSKLFCGRLAQLVERLLHMQEVSGSSPLSPIKNFVFSLLRYLLY